MTTRTAIAMNSCLSLSLVALLVTAITAVPFDDCPAEGDMVTRLTGAEGPLIDEEAPSPAPSAFSFCTSQTSNARGRYTSTLAPCVFTFHRIEEEEDALIDYQTSSLCSSENEFLVMKEYVYNWADECVGTFQRCYSLEHHRDVLFDFLCAMDGKFPEGTTHVSVDCIEDQDLIAESENFPQAAAQQEQTQDRIEQLEFRLINIALIMGSCLAGVYVISHWILKPIVSQSAVHLNGQLLDQQSCTCTDLQSCQCGQWIASQRLSLEIDQSDDNDENHIDFDQQIPADFDAIPIVPATILPAED